MPKYFTPAERDDTLSWLVAEARLNTDFVGCVLVGSGATGFADAFSDIDLVIAVDNSAELPVVSDRWRDYLLEQLSVLAYAPAPRGANVILHNFYLTNYLEINNCLLSLSSLSATRPRYRVLWDRSGTMQGIPDRSWAERSAVSPLAVYYDQRRAGIWHYLNHAHVALRRGKLWQALSDLDSIREQIVHLHAYRHALEPHRNRDVDCMGPDFLAKLSSLLPAQLSAREIRVRLVAAARLFFEESMCVCALLRIPYDMDGLEPRMMELITLDDS